MVKVEQGGGNEWCSLFIFQGFHADNVQAN
jgi:hypothetical protein